MPLKLFGNTKIIKALPITIYAPRPIDEAISSAGGVAFAEMDKHLMLNAQPGLFCADEMLAGDAPTGSHLLTAWMASGNVAGAGVIQFLHKKLLSFPHSPPINAC